MSHVNIETIERAIAAVNARDIDGYLECCTEDVVLCTPLSAVSGVYEGADGIRRFFADVGDAAPDFHLELQHVEPIGEHRVLASIQSRATGRASGIPLEAPSTTNVYDMAGGRIRRIRIFLERGEALDAAGLGGRRTEPR
jgi:ketosteroid isomerase-like protein